MKIRVSQFLETKFMNQKMNDIFNFFDYRKVYKG